jgi:hypothetical protein
VTTRPKSPTAERIVHIVAAPGDISEPVLRWSSREGWRPLLWLSPTLVVVEERASRDHLLVDLSDGSIRTRITRPKSTPVVDVTGLGWFEENSALLVDPETGAAEEFTTDASATPSSLDQSDAGFFWVVDGFTTGEIGLFRFDLRATELVDFRPAAPVEEGEHFFSFDPDRFATTGAAIVAYDSPDAAYLVRLEPDGSFFDRQLPAGHRVVDITGSPSRERWIVLSGLRTFGDREAVLSVFDSGLNTIDLQGDEDLLLGQKLAVWLAAAS